MLEGKRILIVEDEALLALDLTFVMEDMGALVVGPCARLRSALQVVLREQVDGAVLDVDLNGETVFPLADNLNRANVPFVFHTGRHDPGELIRRYDRARVCHKPTSPEAVAEELQKLISPAAAEISH